MLIEKLPEETVLIQLAEEAAELAQAALKMVRALNGDTPVSVDDAARNLVEEVADVLVCTDVLMGDAARKRMRAIRKYKRKRWEERLEQKTKNLCGASGDCE